MTAKQMVKRLKNRSALNLMFVRLFDRSYELLDDWFWSLEQPLNLLSLATREECAK
jgi:hypothetical protein